MEYTKLIKAFVFRIYYTLKLSGGKYYFKIMQYIIYVLCTCYWMALMNFMEDEIHESQFDSLKHFL